MATYTVTFTDTKPWETSVDEMLDEGWVVGKAPGFFDEHAPMTQAEMAVVLVRAKYGLETDLGAGETWWANWVAKAVEDGLMEPIVHPDSPATRAQVVTLMELLLDR